MLEISAAQAFENVKRNANERWNKTASTAERSASPHDASNRIYDRFATSKPLYLGPKFGPEAKVFAMGSCFAREIEWALIKRGGTVISIDDAIQRPEFRDPSGQVRDDLFPPLYY